MLKALIFDFDGLILDTETPEVMVWQSIYREYGFNLPVDEWEKTIGGYGLSNFDAAVHLAALSQGRLDSEKMNQRYRREADMLININPVMPGVMNMIQQAQETGIALAVGSSSPHSWVDTHLKRLGLFHYFKYIVCQDDVPPGHTKPKPDIFLKALNLLKVQQDEAVVFEDSPNGVKAAQTAGVFVVAVPNPLTAKMNVKGDLTVSSLAELSLQELIMRFNNA